MEILDREETYVKPPYRRVYPAVLVSLDDLGAKVAQETLHLIAQRWDDVPIVQNVPLEMAHDASKNAERVAAAVRALHQLELVQALRRQGWRLQHRQGPTIFVLLPSRDRDLHCWGRSVLTALQQHYEQAHRSMPALMGVFLSDENTETTARHAPAAETGLMLGPPDFTAGCYVVKTSNIYGLTFADPQRWLSMIARWIFEMLTTPLGPAVAALPCPSKQSWSSFGLARWRLPTSALLDRLTHRWKIELLAELLAPSAEQQMPGLKKVLLDQPPGWPADPHGAPSTTYRTSTTWPSLRRVTVLHAELDAGFEKAVARLEQETSLENEQLDRLLMETETTLEAEIAALLDTPGSARLNLTLRMVRAAQSAAKRAAAETQQRTLDLDARSEEVEHDRDSQGQALNEAQNTFPAWTLRAWLGVLGRPWWWPRIILRYLHIYREARAYSRVLEHLWLLQQRSREMAWQTAYWRRLKRSLAGLLEQLTAFQRDLRALHEQLTAAPRDVSKLQTQLQAAALPPELYDQLYQRGYAPPRKALDALLSLSPKLSDFVTMREGAAYLVMKIEEQARERFDFINYLRLDQLLIRTYRAAELRARLAELLEAAAPFCASAAAHFSPAERNAALHTTWLSLPDGEQSPLVDLVGADHAQIYVGAAPHTITVVQIMAGIQNTSAIFPDVHNRVDRFKAKEESHE